jgi:hypothetical protein
MTIYRKTDSKINRDISYFMIDSETNKASTFVHEEDRAKSSFEMKKPRSDDMYISEAFSKPFKSIFDK